MRCRWADDRGGVAAEFAAALPAVVIVLGLCLGGIAVGSQQLRLQDAAGAVARGLGRGESVAELRPRVAHASGGAAIESWRADGLVCARLVRAAAGPLALSGLRLTAESCALDGGA